MNTSVQSTHDSSTDIQPFEINKKMNPKAILESISAKVKYVDIESLVDCKLLKKHLQIGTIREFLLTAKANGSDLCKLNGAPAIYNGKHWETLSNDDLQHALSSAAIKVGVSEWDAEHFRFRDDLVKQLYTQIRSGQRSYSGHEVLINLANGTLVFTKDGCVLRPPDSKDYISYQLGFNHIPNAKAPKWQGFLDRVAPDEEVQMVLAEYIGSIFVPSKFLKLEKVLLLIGDGANGKSVFFDVVSALIGRENISNLSLQMLTDVEKGGPYRARLAGKLLTYGSEITSKMDTTMFKALISGEPIEAKALYGQPFELENYGKFIFNANSFPKDTEQTHGFYRRFLMVPFDVTIPAEEQDESLAEKIIENELPGILNWAIDGMNRLVRQKRFTTSTQVEAKLAQFRKESDNVLNFIDERAIIPSVTDTIPLMTLYEDFKTFCKAGGFQACNNRTFSSRLKNYGFTSDRKSAGMVVYATEEVF